MWARYRSEYFGRERTDRTTDEGDETKWYPGVRSVGECHGGHYERIRNNKRIIETGDVRYAVQMVRENKRD